MVVISAQYLGHFRLRVREDSTYFSQAVIFRYSIRLP